MSIVVDASLSLAWCFEDEDTPRVRSVLQRVHVEGGIVPVIWYSEIANALLVAEKRKRISSRDTRAFCDFLQRLGIVTDPVQPTLTSLLDYARTLGLTAYDALYAELAERHGLPLATNDDVLRRAAVKANVAVI